MRFELSPDQVAFRDAVRDLLAKECPPAVVRAAWDAAPGELDRGVWDSLDAMGVLGVLVPEADGGLGLDETFLVPVLEECGRVALPHPIVDTAMVAAPLLGLDAGMVSTDLGGLNLPCGLDADTLLLHDGDRLTSAGPAEAGLVPTATVDGARRASRRPEPGTPSTRSGHRVAQAAPPSEPETPGARSRHRVARAARPVTDDPAAIALAYDRGALGTAAVLLGLGQAMLDRTVEYVRERHQFGVPIGSFQAVKHHLADVALALELTRPAVWRAAWSIAHDTPTRAREVSMAKVLAGEAAQRSARAALQCHGAIGYTVEHDLHLFMKRTWALARAWGDTAHHTDRVADALGA